MVKAQILVVEDQAATADLIVDILRSEGYDVTTVDSLAKARARLKKHPPELLILDRNLPDGDGVDLIPEVRESDDIPALSIIVLSAQKEVQDKVQGLRVGADDYVAKPFNTEELAARVGALLRRKGHLEETRVLESAGVKLDREARKTWVGGKEVPLSAKEFDLMWLLVARRNHVLTRDFLLQHVWGYDAGVDLKTKVIDVTLSHLRQKIGSPADKIVAVRGFGYRFDG